MRYIELNPVRANLADSPIEYRWSSAIAHVTGEPDGATDLVASADYVDDWKGFLESGLDDDYESRFRQNVISCLPVGSDKFLDALHRISGQKTRPGKKGRPSKQKQ
jgi:putative transposase